MTDIVIFDIDGTIADCDHRLHFIKNKPKNWKKFFELVDLDTPISEIIDVGIKLSKQYPIIMITGRSDQCYPKTKAWLDLHFPYYTDLLMRNSRDFRPDYVVKQQHVDDLRTQGFNPIKAFDDRQGCVDMYRQNGIETFHIRKIHTIDCGE